jgi:hypothetical protein
LYKKILQNDKTALMPIKHFHGGQGNHNGLYPVPAAMHGTQRVNIFCCNGNAAFAPGFFEHIKNFQLLLFRLMPIALVFCAAWFIILNYC